MNEIEIEKLDELATAALHGPFIVLQIGKTMPIPRNKAEEFVMFCTPSRVKKLIYMLRRANMERDEARGLHADLNQRLSALYASKSERNASS